jgi:hypothetical protein
MASVLRLSEKLGPPAAGGGVGVGLGVWANDDRLRHARIVIICKTKNGCLSLARMRPPPFMILRVKGFSSQQSQTCGAETNRSSSLPSINFIEVFIQLIHGLVELRPPLA